MLVDFDKTFKREPDKEQYIRVVNRLIEERKCVMCENSNIEVDYEHGNETYVTTCRINGMLRDGKTGIGCQYWKLLDGVYDFGGKSE